MVKHTPPLNDRLTDPFREVKKIADMVLEQKEIK